MANFLTTPLMGLTNPVPGVDPGPDYATNIYNSLNIVDGHNHSSGSGNPIGTNGILINADLPFNTTFNATLLRSVRLVAQTSPLAGASDLGCIYESGVDLWFNDGDGNQVQITSGGNVNATSSGISSGTASAAFSGSVLVVNSNTNTPANIQCGSVLIGDTTVSPNFVTLTAPVALAANYPLVFPAALPGSQKFMTLDSSGNIAAPWAVDNSTLQIASGTTVQVKDAGITDSKLASGAAYSNIGAGGVDGTLIATGVVLNGLPSIAGSTSRRIISTHPGGSASTTVLFGVVNTAGTILNGTGFTVARNGTGDWSITYTNNFTGDAAVVCEPIDAGSLVVGTRVLGVSVGGFRLFTVNASNNAADPSVGFNFIVVGLA